MTGMAWLAARRRWMMDVYEAVTSRRAVRGFTDEPVSREVLERVLSAAAWSPSGSNVQPWNIYVMTGAPLAELKTLAVERVAHGDPWDLPICVGEHDIGRAVWAMLIGIVEESAKVRLNAQYVEVVSAGFVLPDIGWIFARIQP